MFMLMRVLKCSSSWAPNKDHLCTQQMYKASIGKSLDLNPLGESPGQVSFPALPFDNNPACLPSHKWKIGYKAYA